MRKWLELRKEEDAQALVEFTLILPVLILLVLGMIEFGWMLNAKITLNSAVREGARVGAVSDEAQAEAKTIEIAGVSGITLAGSEVEALPSGGYMNVVVTKDIEPIIRFYIKEAVTMTAEARMRIE